MSTLLKVGQTSVGQTSVGQTSVGQTSVAEKSRHPHWDVDRAMLLTLKKLKPFFYTKLKFWFLFPFCKF